MTKKYWKGLEELKETPEFLQQRDQEFPQSMSVDEFLADENLKESSTGRRDFLKFLGFSVAAATIAACEAPVTKAIPYVNKPENVTPGMPTWYASTYYDGTSYASILVKTREGRPIYIKGNKDFGISKGVTNAQIIASVLPLYDSARLTSPMMGTKTKSWSDVDGDIKSRLNDIIAKKGKVTLVSSTIISPSTQTAIDMLKAHVNGGNEAGMSFEHIQYDAVSYAGMRAANKEAFGLTVNNLPENDGIIPDYDFSKAKTIVSVGADFLSSWLLSTEYQAQYAMRRNPDGEWMSKHFQFEAVMSITGSNADYRGMVKPSEEANVLSYILGKFGVSTGVSTKLSTEATKIADRAVAELKKSKSESLVVAGSNNKAVQLLANKLNAVLGAYTKTINVNNPVALYASQDAKMGRFVADVIGGKGPDAVIFYGVNPVYSLADGEKFGKALKNVGLTVSLASYADETASLCKYIAPDHHALEAWNDYNVKMNHYAIAQPTIRPLHNTAAAQESFMVWSGKASRGGKDSKVYYELIRNNWVTYGFPMQTEYADADTYWGMMVHDSCSDIPAVAATSPAFNDGALSGISSQVKAGKGIEIVLYQKAGIGTGDQANNPWLQELPDPISKVTWDNYITMNPSEMDGKYATTFDQENGLNVATVKVGGVSLTLPVYPSPGQAIGTIGIALGYGRGANNENIGNAAFQTKEYGGHATDDKGNRKPIGQNAFRLVRMENGTMSFCTEGSVTKVDGEIYPIAATQIHHTVMARRSIVRETTLDIYKNNDKEAYNPAYTLQKLDAEGNHVERPIEEFDLWDAHPVDKVGHRWGMTIDLNQCFGCGSCMIACQSENNVPVVGKDEVRRGREMHWLRIDRYFASDEEATVGMRKDRKTFSFGKAEIAAENPKVVHMPMLCHHCNHAPCETVCPVAATNHSNEGLNQMAYNRCIGTRYCANNCPYKVRRFNWFNYPSYKKFTQVNPAQDDLGRMVLNPDVTVRTRGVMEKCSFCVQKIQSGKLTAKKEARPVVDGDVTTACAEACPTNAITFGDYNDLKSEVRKSAHDKRAYQALEEVGVKPNIWYKMKIRNEKNDLLEKLHVEKGGHDMVHHDKQESKKAHH
ncbi:MAG: TAT-variant-translocated molybdopterin oxidoreductase [Bacteroidota bacterium]